MSNHVIEFDQECRECDGAGLYSGMGEREGAAVICYVCNGTGCKHVKIEYDDFEGRKASEATRVHQVNPGICINAELRFGGMSYADWNAGKPFPPGSENRLFTCPAWWYQAADYDKKPDWKECLGCGIFSSCEHFGIKDTCWNRWDEEYT